MATRSRIGKLQNDGTVRSIYCHWDGYIENNGKILVENYKDEEVIDRLLNVGDISSLREMPEDIGQGYGKEARVSQSVEDYLGIGEEYNYLFKDGEWYVDYVDEDAYERDEDDIRRMDKVIDLLK